MISEARCRAKLLRVFKNAQRQSKAGRFFLLQGGLSQLRVVILSEFLSLGSDIASPVACNVLQ